MNYYTYYGVKPGLHIKYLNSIGRLNTTVFRSRLYIADYSQSAFHHEHVAHPPHDFYALFPLRRRRLPVRLRSRRSSRDTALPVTPSCRHGNIK